MTPDLRVFRLVPAAAPTDAGWELSPFTGEVVVCARSPGEARAVAASEEAGMLAENRANFDQGVVREASAFTNTNLYSVVATGEDIPARHADASRVLRWPEMST